MRVIFMGTPDFSLAPLAEIAEQYQAAYERLSIAERESVMRLAEWPSIDANDWSP